MRYFAKQIYRIKSDMTIPVSLKQSFLTFGLMILIHSAFSQARDWEVVSGIGFPDVVHVGVNMDVSPKSFLGINLGYIPSEGKTVQFTFEHKTNFRYSKSLTGRPTWYFGERLTYFYENNDTKVWRTLYLTPAIGRHLNVTARFGLNVDAGIFIRVWGKESECSGGCDDDSRDSFDPISPTARFQIFYQL